MARMKLLAVLQEMGQRSDSGTGTRTTAARSAAGSITTGKEQLEKEARLRISRDLLKIGAGMRGLLARYSPMPGVERR